MEGKNNDVEKIFDTVSKELGLSGVFSYYSDVTKTHYLHVKRASGSVIFLVHADEIGENCESLGLYVINDLGDGSIPEEILVKISLRDVEKYIYHYVAENL